MNIEERKEENEDFRFIFFFSSFLKMEMFPLGCLLFFKL